MKRLTKRILCSALSLSMACTLAVEYGLRTSAETIQSTTTSRSLSIENVTGTYNTTALRETYFNDQVLDVSDTAPVYETRSVIVTLKGDTVFDSADGASVSHFARSWSGHRVQDAIATQQDQFLAALKQKGIEYKLNRRYDTLINGVSIEVDTQHVSAIKQMKGVDSVVIANSYAAPEAITTKATTVVENNTTVYDTGIYDAGEYAKYGEGTVVAVLDTGLDYTHPAFQDFKSDDVDFAWDESYVRQVLEDNELKAESRSGALSAAQVYVNEKVPFAYDYADDDPDVYPSYSNHGVHVAGIIAGYDPNGYTDKDGNPIAEPFVGVVPNAQLAICKVFTDDLDDPDIGGAVTDDIVAALEDCVTLGVDVINMSLGTSCGFTTTDDGDDEGELLNAVYTRIQEAGITLSAAASNDYSAGYGGAFGTNLASNPDSSTVGSPSTFAASLSVASINGQKASYMIANEADEANKAFVFFEEARDIDSNPFDFVSEMLAKNPSGEFEYVVVDGIGERKDYSNKTKELLKEKPRLVLVKRGTSSFEDKVKVAKGFGAAGIIVYNNVAGIIRMNLGEIEEERIPAVSISMSTGNALRKAAKSGVGTIKINPDYKAGPFMSEFSSWGPTHDLKLKPEITAHGGEITSAVPGGYGEQSGTSMAAPNMAGFMAIARGYVEEKFGLTDAREINRLATQLTMSTAVTAYDQDNYPYSPRKQGAGLARIENAIDGTGAYLYTNNAANDYRPKIEFGDDPTKVGEYTLQFNVKNFSDKELKFETESLFMTESLASDGIAVNEQACMLDDRASIWMINGQEVDTITVAAGADVTISVTLSLSAEEKEYLDGSFKNGMYVEGFLKLISQTAGQCDLSIPFLGFYGDWKAAPMLDYTAYEIAASEKDASIEEEEKIKASVWGTQPYSMYYNEKYVLPMGGYLYLLDENDEGGPVYADEAHCAISRYNEYYGEGNEENYLTSTGIKAVYAGLLRNARIVKYRMYNVETGEMIITDGEINRVGKAYSGGGQAVPANVELEFSPEDYDLVANGMYRMEFEFYMDAEDVNEPCPEENTFAFSFTVDYDAPVLENARVRYYNYKEGNKEKQRIYLDVDIYDNHYAQALMVCYPTKNAQGTTVLQLATEYPTPIRDAEKNSTTTVTVEITDIYQELCEKYGNQLYLQIDDYALNSCLYRVPLGDANAALTPENNQFGLADGEESIALGIYETHKVALTYSESVSSDVNLSNFLWMSQNPAVADVKNGEIVGLSVGTTTIFVSNRKGDVKEIQVTVNDTVSTKLPNYPTLSFGVIKGAEDWLSQAAGSVAVAAGREFTLQLNMDPWYHPMTNLVVKWESTNPAVATVDQNGNVQTLKKGTTTIKAILQKQLENGKLEETTVLALVTLRVQNEFTVSNYTLTKYNGVGYNGEICGGCGMAWMYSELEAKTEGGAKEYCPDCGELVKGGVTVLKVPTDMNIWYIGESAFEDNDNVQRIILPDSVTDIQEWAFMNCTALEEVYFVSTLKEAIPTAKVKMIYQQAFYGCTKLKKVDFSNVKTVTVSDYCFAGCTSLKEVVDMPKISTMHDAAFMGCTSLKEVDITGLHMSGANVFADCTSLANITTGKFTAIGDYMFSGCTSLREKVEIETTKIGAYAFKDCVNLSGVQLRSPEGEALRFDIGAGAFENCGNNLTGNFTVEFDGEIIRTIGDRAFANSSLKSFGTLKGLEEIGDQVFCGTYVKTLTLGDGVDFSAVLLSGVPFAGIELTVAEDSAYYTSENGIIYNKDKTEVIFVNASVSGEVTLPNSVKSIAAYAFARSNVTKLNLTNVETIGEYAFSESKIQTVAFGASALTEIPDGAFYASALKEINVPDSVKTIGQYAFSESALSSYVGGDNVEEIKSYAFANCKTLKTITLADGIQVMGNNVFANCSNLQTVQLPSLGKLGAYTFRGARNLKKVTFGKNASVTGTYTFDNTSVTTVTLGNNVTELGAGLFNGVRTLQTIALPNGVTKIGDYAFQNASALKKVNGIEHVTHFGRYSFWNTRLEALDLTSAEEIGYAAFAADEETSYKTLTLSAIKTIGDYAFMNGGASTVALPASVEAIGIGAFASSNGLTKITISEENENFFAEDGVLYRYLDAAAKKYEIVCYPAAKVAADGSYAIKEGTVSIKAHAFYQLQKGALAKVTLPYSVKTIGDGAFYQSGIIEYTFESIQAPVLETVHNQEITDRIEEMATQLTAAYYRGYYYSNFDSLFVEYTQYGNKTSEYVMYYPENGIGYDNHLYKTYFGVRKSLGIRIEDTTRQFVNWIEAEDTSATLESLLQATVTNENKVAVRAFANEVKTYRLYYNNIVKDTAQAQFITQEHADTLLAIEQQMRGLKQKFGILSQITGLKLASESTHRNVYKIGETFDMTGLVVTVIYDDYSTETLTADQLTLETTRELNENNRSVYVSYKGERLLVMITVNETGTLEEDSSSSDSATSTPTADLTWLWIVIGTVLVLGGGVAVWFLFIKKKATPKTDSVDRVETVENAENVETAEETEENEAESNE